MLDLKYVVENIDEVIKKLNTRNSDFTYLKELVELADERSKLIHDVESKKAFRNEVSKKIGEYKREKKDVTEILNEVASLGDEIKEIDNKVNEVNGKINNILLNTPNIPDSSVPVGVDESSNVVLRKYLEPTKFDFEIKDHVELGEDLDIIDFTRAAKVTGARFVFYKGLAARLERALMQFMMDVHTFEGGYIEAIPPYIVNEESMYGTGQFPKFREESFKLE
ncbi:MAG TPA: serine--tRNA ligase, partial [Acholeplasma sp.]|nr:serine--tRNA ligase [Acholeplasma sp.]